MLGEALNVGTLVDPQKFGKRSCCGFPVIAAVYAFFTVVCAKESEQKGLGLQNNGNFNNGSWKYISQQLLLFKDSIMYEQLWGGWWAPEVLKWLGGHAWDTGSVGLCALESRNFVTGCNLSYGNVWKPFSGSTVEPLERLFKGSKKLQAQDKSGCITRGWIQA